jgi:hypothetical protein
MPAAEISMAIASVRAMGDIFKGLVSLHIDSQVKEGIIKAQNETLQLQSHMFDILAKFEQLTAENRELKEKLKEKEDWTVTAAKYRADRIPYGKVVYRLREPRDDFEMSSEFCAFCFGNKKIVLLQNRYCHECKLLLEQF